MLQKGRTLRCLEGSLHELFSSGATQNSSRKINLTEGHCRRLCQIKDRETLRKATRELLKYERPPDSCWVVSRGRVKSRPALN